jgi:two-component sensor histidine kinase
VAFNPRERLKSKDAMTSTISNVRARASSVEPILLVEEISHRVVNELTVAILSLRHEASRIVDTDARDVLQRVAARLTAFADAHRALQSPDTASDMNLGDYLNDLLGRLSQASLRGHGVTLRLLEDDITLEPDRCWRVGLIIAELVTNAAKHGPGGRGSAIVVEVRRAGPELFCAVADSGGSATKHPSPSRGLRLVEALAAELEGDVDWSFRPNGVTALLRFPIVTDAPRSRGRSAVFGA